MKKRILAIIIVAVMVMGIVVTLSGCKKWFEKPDDSSNITFETNGGSEPTKEVREGYEKDGAYFYNSVKAGFKLEGWYYDKALEHRTTYPIFDTKLSKEVAMEAEMKAAYKNGLRIDGLLQSVVETRDGFLKDRNITLYAKWLTSATNTRGNSNSNIVNGSMFATEMDKIYYSSSSLNWSYYGAEQDGGTLGNFKGTCLNVINNVFYGINADGRIMTYTPPDKNATVFDGVTLKVSNLHLIGDSMYFLSAGVVYNYNIALKAMRKFEKTSDAEQMSIGDGMAYYKNSKDKLVYALDLKSGNVSCIIQEVVERVVFEDGKIYFTTFLYNDGMFQKSNYFIKSYDFKTTTIIAWDNEGIYNIGVCDGYVYFTRYLKMCRVKEKDRSFLPGEKDENGKIVENSALSSPTKNISGVVGASMYDDLSSNPLTLFNNRQMMGHHGAAL